jgi:hypothetical protein
MQYLARVHCCGSRWLIHAPAVQAWTLTEHKQSIKSIAQQIISSSTGEPADAIGLDLTVGRVLGSVEEFTAAHLFAQHWEPHTVGNPAG